MLSYNGNIDISPETIMRDDLLFIGSGSGLPFAGLYVKDSSATVSVDQDNADTIVTQWTTNTPSNNCTPDQANNKITITKAGVYGIEFDASYSVNAGVAITCRFEGYLGGVIQPALHCHRTISTTAIGNVKFKSFIDITSVPVDLDIRANINSSTARNLTMEYAHLNVEQKGGT